MVTNPTHGIHDVLAMLFALAEPCNRGRRINFKEIPIWYQVRFTHQFFPITNPTLMVPNNLRLF